ncbi:MAG TPA: FAD-dependent monooxygenase [Nocardioidaceae bacterium]|nr:FAD-dependent monooxygenase [Nocardioidaceae bacterium]
MDVPVLVVGGGPTGLAAAAVLAASGVGCRIVDRSRIGELESRAAVIHIRTLELLDRLGVAADAVASGTAMDKVRVYDDGHSLGMISLAGGGAAGWTPFPYALGLQQGKTVRLLEHRLESFGTRVDWGTTLVGLEQHAGGILAQVQHGDGRKETIDCAYVIGADGSRSTVRDLAGVAFPGAAYEQNGFLADVTFSPGTIPTDRSDQFSLNLTNGGFVGINPVSDGRFRLFGALTPQLQRKLVASPPTPSSSFSRPTLDRDDIQSWFDQRFRILARIEDVHWTSYYTIQRRLAATYRVGNVFLAGDAAHLHSPAGGQGMNMGVGDGVNLAWKLSAVLTGRAEPGLLDSYQAERRPVARRILDGADKGFELEATDNRIIRTARRALMPPVLRASLHVPWVRRAVANLFSQTWISYRDSPAVDPHSPRRRGPQPGDRAPHAVTSAPGGLHGQLPGVNFDALVLQGSATDVDFQRALRLVEGVARLRGVGVHAVPADDLAVQHAYGSGAGLVCLVRPDGYVAQLRAFTELPALAAGLTSNASASVWPSLSSLANQEGHSDE